MTRILVVDDEPDQRILLRRIFEKAGHQVIDAVDGAAALRAAQAGRSARKDAGSVRLQLDPAELI